MLGPLAAAPGTQLGPLAVGRGPSAQPEAVVWASIVNATVDAPNTLRKTAGGVAWNAGAVSTKAIPSGSGGYVEATIGAVLFLIGLSNGNTDAGFNDTDYAAYPSNDNRVYAYEKGVFKSSKLGFSLGDTVRVAVSSAGVVTYSHNGVVFYTSLAAPSFPLLVDSSILNVGGTIVGATIYAAAGLVPSGY